MISSNSFDHFLKIGFIEGLSPGTSMEKLLMEFGDDFWSVKDTELNGLIYGIIKVGFIEFHIYNETINGVSYRPDIYFSKKDFKGLEIPWVGKKRSLQIVENELSHRNISYKKYTIKGPLKNFRAAGTDLIGLADCEYTFIDTEGGVTFLFEENSKNGKLETYQVCKYYDIHKPDKITSV